VLYNVRYFFVMLSMCKVINALMKAVGCSQRAAVDFATTVDREVCCDNCRKAVMRKAN